MTTPSGSPQQPEQSAQDAVGSQPCDPAPSLGAERDSFFGALFDFSFGRYATPMIARALYLLVFIVIASVVLLGLVGLVSSLLTGAGLGILAFVLGVPLLVLTALAGLALYRIYLEVAVSIIRTSQSVQAIDARQARELGRADWDANTFTNTENTNEVAADPTTAPEPKLPEGFREQLDNMDYGEGAAAPMPPSGQPQPGVPTQPGAQPQPKRNEPEDPAQ